MPVEDGENGQPEVAICCVASRGERLGGLVGGGGWQRVTAGGSSATLAAAPVSQRVFREALDSLDEL